MIRLHEVRPHLYQRGHMEQYSATQKGQLVYEYGLQLVIGTFRRPDPDLPDVMAQAGGRYVHVAFPDGRKVDVDGYDALAQQGAETIRQGGAVLVHCHGGRNRSGLVNALIVRELDGCSGEEAMLRVKAARKGSLVNEHFCNYLMGLR